jgi:hypothetical protein
MSALSHKRTSQTVRLNVCFTPKADIAERSHHLRFVPSTLMSGAGGAIAALEKTKANCVPGVPVCHPPKNEIENAFKKPLLSAQFF